MSKIDRVQAVLLAVGSSFINKTFSQRIDEVRLRCELVASGNTPVFKNIVTESELINKGR